MGGVCLWFRGMSAFGSGWCLPLGQGGVHDTPFHYPPFHHTPFTTPHPLSVDKQSPVKILPSPKLRLRVVKSITNDNVFLLVLTIGVYPKYCLLYLYRWERLEAVAYEVNSLDSVKII